MGYMTDSGRKHNLHCGTKPPAPSPGLRIVLQKLWWRTWDEQKFALLRLWGFLSPTLTAFLHKTAVRLLICQSTGSSIHTLICFGRCRAAAAATSFGCLPFLHRDICLWRHWNRSHERNRRGCRRSSCRPAAKNAGRRGPEAGRPLQSRVDGAAAEDARTRAARRPDGAGRGSRAAAAVQAAEEPRRAALADLRARYVLRPLRVAGRGAGARRGRARGAARRAVI